MVEPLGQGKSQKAKGKSEKVCGSYPLFLTLASLPYEPQAEGGSCCHRTPRNALRLTARGHSVVLSCVRLFVQDHDKLTQPIHALKEADMRVLLHATLPHEPFNTFVKDGSVSAKMKRILDEQKPEAVYFTEFDGHRSALLILQMEDGSQIPSVAEPWFVTFNADCHLHPVMVPEDLAKADLAALGKKWA